MSLSEKRKELREKYREKWDIKTKGNLWWDKIIEELEAQN